MIIYPVVFWLGVAGVAILAALVMVDRIRVGRRFRKLEEKLSGEVVPYWRGIQANLIEDLTHPHEAAERVDELLALLKDDPQVAMKDADRAELLDGLARRAAGDDPKISPRERRKAALFPLIMEEVQEEAKNPNAITIVQVVGLKEPDTKESSE